MRKRKLYLDTSVWNHYFSIQRPDYHSETVGFFEKAKLGLFDLHVSNTVIAEMLAAPDPVKTQLVALLSEVAPQVLASSEEMNRMAALYIARRVLPPKSTADAEHVAYATVYQMDLLVSWNIRHLANINRRDRVTALNLEEGYSHPLILGTPLEVMGDETE